MQENEINRLAEFLRGIPDVEFAVLVGSRADLYSRETADLARRHSALFADARTLMKGGKSLTPLEENGVLHALQVLIENAIGKAKQTLKLAGEPVNRQAT